MRSRLVACLALAAAGALLLCGAVPAGAACGGVQRAQAHKKHKRYRAPLVVGDSVVLGAMRQLAAVGYEVDTRGCRQFSEGVAVLRRRRHTHSLPHFAVIALGANWVITRREVHQAMRIMGRKRMLGLMTPRELGGGSGSDARLLRDEGRRHPKRIKVLDWVTYSAGHGSWFAGDGLHLGPGGARGMARLYRRALRYAAPPHHKPRPKRPPPPPPAPSPEPPPAPAAGAAYSRMWPARSLLTISSAAIAAPAGDR
jgi:hypothetical protein